MSINPKEGILEVVFFSNHQQVLSPLLFWTDFSPSPHHYSNLVSHKTTTIAPVSNLVPCRGLSLKGTSDSFTTLYKIPQQHLKKWTSSVCPHYLHSGIAVPWTCQGHSCFRVFAPAVCSRVLFSLSTPAYNWLFLILQVPAKPWPSQENIPDHHIGVALLHSCHFPSHHDLHPFDKHLSSIYHMLTK